MLCATPAAAVSHQGERLFFGKSTQPCPPANVWSEGSCFVTKKYGKIIPSYRGRSEMICGRLMASPEQSWGWNFGDSRAPAPSLLLSSTVGNGFVENSQSTQGIQGRQTEQLLLAPGMFSHPMGSVPQLFSTQKWNVLEDLEHTGNLQDKTSNHRKLSVPIQTKKIREKQKKKINPVTIKNAIQEFHLPHLMESIHTVFYL